MPAVDSRNIGRRSVSRPTPGCSSEAVHWKTRCISPIWVKLSAKFASSTG